MPTIIEKEVIASIVLINVVSLNLLNKDGIFSNVEEMTLLHHGCTHMVDWLEPSTNELTRVTLKRIVDRQNAQSLDFHLYQVNYK